MSGNCSATCQRANNTHVERVLLQWWWWWCFAHSPTRRAGQPSPPAQTRPAEPAPLQGLPARPGRLLQLACASLLLQRSVPAGAAAAARPHLRLVGPQRRVDLVGSYCLSLSALCFFFSMLLTCRSHLFRRWRAGCCSLSTVFSWSVCQLLSLTHLLPRLEKTDHQWRFCCLHRPDAALLDTGAKHTADLIEVSGFCAQNAVRGCSSAKLPACLLRWRLLALDLV